MTSLMRDIRYAARSLRGSRGFALASVATLAIGVGGTAAIFTILNGVLLRPLPIPEANRLVSVATVNRDAAGRPATVSLEELQDWQRESRTFAAMAAWRDWGMARHVDGATEPAFAIVATPEIFQVLQVQPVVGRLFTAADDRPGSNRRVLLCEPYWRERFGADAGVVGRTLTLERGEVADYEVIGVLPAAFSALPSFEDVKIVALSSIDPDASTGRDVRNRQVFGRLTSAAGVVDARAEMAVLAARMARAHPATNTGWGVTVAPLIDREVGPIGDSLRSLFAAVGFLFLITCANIAALQLARALSRRREFSIRQALGDSRRGLTRSLIVESLLVSIAAGVLGLYLATWLVDLAIAKGPAMPRADGIRFETPVFVFALAISIVAGLLVSIPATLLATRLDLTLGLKQESTQIANVPAARVRMVFVATQVALAMVLVGGALMAGASLVRQLTLRPGFEPRGLATVSVTPPMRKYATAEQVASLYARIIEAARNVPGVESATAVSATPLSGEGAEPVEFSVLDGRNRPAQPATYTARYFNAAPAHFSTLGVPVRRGREFLATDTASSPHVAVVNEAFVRTFIADAEPIGTRVRLARSGDVVTIVGVSADLLRDLQPGAVPSPEMYWPYAQHPRWTTMLVIRAANPTAVMPAVIDRVRRLDADLRVGTPRLMADRVARSSRAPRFMLLMSGLFAGLALLLSAIGVYALVSYTFAQRVREIGIRVSLGASPRQILRLVASSGFAAVLAGSVAGGLLLAALARPLAAALPQLGSIDPLTIGLASLLLVLVGCAACYMPARRAASMDPVRAMRIP